MNRPGQGLTVRADFLDRSDKFLTSPDQPIFRGSKHEKGNETEWRDAVVSDERSFSMDMVKVAAGILNKSAIPEDQITGPVLSMPNTVKVKKLQTITCYRNIYVLLLL